LDITYYKDGELGDSTTLNRPIKELAEQCSYSIQDRDELKNTIGNIGQVIIQKDIALNYEWVEPQLEDNGGTIINPDGDSSGSWKAIYDGAVNVKWFDNIENWFMSSNYLIGDPDIEINLEKPISKDINTFSNIDFRGMKIKYIGPATNSPAIRLNVVSDITSISAKNLTIDCDDKLSCGLDIATNNSDNTALWDIIDNIKVVNVKSSNDTTSAIGINSNLNSLSIIINNNIVENVNRTSTNAGVIASVGIRCVGSENNITVSNNNVKNIFSPDDTLADADGIQIFSKGSHSDDEQDINIQVYGNTISQCHGRLVKLQTPNTKFYGNNLILRDIAVQNEYTAVDAQIGSLQAHDNFIRFTNITRPDGGEFTGHTAIFSANFSRDAGEQETFFTVHNNTFIMNTTQWYSFVMATVGENRKINYKVHDNSIYGIDMDYMKLSFFSRLVVYDGFKEIVWEVHNNSFPLVHGGTAIYFRNTTNNLASDDNGPSYTEKVHCKFVNNTALPQKYDGTNYAANYILRSLFSGIMYLQDITISGNSNMRDDIELKGLKARKLPNGTNFRYIGDGTDNGGFTDTPDGYIKNVNVEKSERCLKITHDTGDKFAINYSLSGDFYEYAGTAL